MMTTKSPYLFEGQGSAIDHYMKPQALVIITEGGRGHSKSNWAIFDKNNQQHKTILSLLRQAQWTTSHDRHGEVADLERLSNFLKSTKSPVNKPLKAMEPDEVSKIIEALKGIVKSKYK